MTYSATFQLAASRTFKSITCLLDQLRFFANTEYTHWNLLFIFYFLFFSFFKFSKRPVRKPKARYVLYLRDTSKKTGNSIPCSVVYELAGSSIYFAEGGLQIPWNSSQSLYMSCQRIQVGCLFASLSVYNPWDLVADQTFHLVALTWIHQWTVFL
jgi:hypothetical protein